MAHGEAVAIGMVAEARIAARAGLAPAALADRIARLLAVLGLPTSVPPRFRPAAILQVARRDKKARLGRIAYALPVRLGAMAHDGAEYGLAVEDAEVASVLRSR
jgi:3-dehydroquinate synthase